MISTDPWVWLAALLSISCISLLYGDNKFFRWAETTYTASVIGHSAVMALDTIRVRYTPLFTGASLHLIIPFVLGLLSLSIAWKKYAWLATISMALIIGIGTGFYMSYYYLSSYTLANLRAVISETAGILSGTPTDQLGNLVRIVFTVAALSYFLFTLIPKGPTSKPFVWLQTLGKYALITYIGIAIGNTMQQFTGCATSMIYRIVGQWLGLG